MRNEKETWEVAKKRFAFAVVEIAPLVLTVVVCFIQGFSPVTALTGILKGETVTFSSLSPLALVFFLVASLVLLRKYYAKKENRGSLFMGTLAVVIFFSMLGSSIYFPDFMAGEIDYSVGLFLVAGAILTALIIYSSKEKRGTDTATIILLCWILGISLFLGALFSSTPIAISIFLAGVIVVSTGDHLHRGFKLCLKKTSKK